MGGGYRARGATGRDAPRPAAGRQAGPVGVEGLERRQRSRAGTHKFGRREAT